MTNHDVSGSRAMRAVVSCILAIYFIFPAVGAVAAQADDDTGLVSDAEYDLLTGNVLTWDDPWTVVEDQTGFDTSFMGDYIVLLDDEASRLDFHSEPSIGTVQSNLDFTASLVGYSYDNGELLEHEADKLGGHSILRFSSGGFQYAAYLEIQSTSDRSTLLYTLLISPADDIADVIEGVQDAIELDGDPLLDAVDPDDVQDVVDDGEAIDFPVDRNQFSFSNDDSPDENEDVKLPDEESTPEDEGAVDPEALGLVDSTTYESPQFGTEVLWGDEWTADTSLLTSDEDEGVDRVALGNPDFDADLYLSFYGSSDVSPEDWADSFVSTFDTKDSDLTILDQDESDGVVTFYYRLDSDDGSRFGIVETRLSSDGDVTVVVELLGAKSDVRDAFTSAQDEITIDDDALFQEFRRFPRIKASDEG